MGNALCKPCWGAILWSVTGQDFACERVGVKEYPWRFGAFLRGNVNGAKVAQSYTPKELMCALVGHGKMDHFLENLP